MARKIQIQTADGNEVLHPETDVESVVGLQEVISSALGGMKIWAGSAADYAQLTPANDTIYFIAP